MESEIEAVTALVDTLIEFAVAYGFQIAGALVFLVIGLKVSAWAGRRVTQLALAKEIDETLAKFMGTGVKVVFVSFLIIITLGNFGISIAPLIALASAAAFGASFAIILGRPITVGDTITVKSTSGDGEEVKLGATVLITEDSERITGPDKHVVGEVIVNSRDSRIVESRIGIALVRRALTATDSVAHEPMPQVG
ncbi:MAG: mechanosensitive ion channel domain-containing protein, partial [Alphaproteobacteria bacterium]